MDDIACAVEEFDEFHDATLVAEFISEIASFIADANPHTAVEEGEFLESFDEGIVDEFGVGEDLVVGLERRFRAAFGRSARFADLSCGDPAFVGLGPHFPVSVDFDFAPLG